MVEIAETVSDEISVPEDASSDSFLEDARKAVLEESGQEFSQEESQEETVTETDSSNPDLTVKEESDGELDKPFVGSRREAYRLAEERKQALEVSQRQTEEVSRRLEEYQKADSELAGEVLKALATEEEYQNLTYRSRNGDVSAGSLLQQIDANRQFYAKLQGKAQRDITGYFTDQLVSAAKEAGLPDDLVFKGTPAEMVKSAFDLGKSKAEAELGVRIESLEAELKGVKTGTVSRRAGSQVLSGGSSAAGDAMGDLYGPDGLPTDESIAAARSGRLRGLF